MKNPHSMHTHNNHPVNAVSITIGDHIYSELDIIKIQDQFLTNGLHVITVANQLEGQILIDTILSSMACYQKVATISYQQHTLYQPTVNLYHQLVAGGYVDPVTETCINLDSLDQFFLESFFIDFLWIDACWQLQLAPWYNDFEQRMKALHFDQTMPIIKLKG